jgi:phage-related protein
MAKGPGGFSVGRVSVKVVPDTSDFRRDLLRELKTAVKGIKVEIPVQVNAKTALAQLKVLDSILKKVDRTVTPVVNLKTNTDKGGLETLNKNLDTLKKNTDRASDGFTRMSHAALIGVAVLLLAAPVIALVATLLAGLPSLLLALLAPIAAISLGAEGFAKAAEKFAPTVERLKKSLSANFQEGLTPVFERLNKLAPVLDKGLNQVADSVIHILDQLSLLVTAPETMQQLATILSNVAFFLKEISPAINQGVAAFLKLGSVASGSFDILARSLNDFSTSFLEMVNRISESGQLTAALEGLNKVLNAVLQSFVSLFESGIRAMSVLGGPMAQFISSFFNLLVELMPVLTAISNLVFRVLSKAFGVLMSVIQELTPAFELFADVLGTLLIGSLETLAPILTALARILGQVVLKVLQTIQPFIPVFLDFFTKLGTLIGDFLLGAFTALTPFLDQFLAFFTELLVALIPLMPVLIQFASDVLRTILDILGQLGPELVELGRELFPKLLQVIKDIVPIAIEFLKVLSDVLPVLADLAVIILDIVVPAMQEMFKIIEQVWPSIKQIIEGVLLHLQGVINVIMGIMTGDIDRAMNGMKQIFQGAWEIIKGIVKTALTAVLDLLVGLPSRIAVALLGLPAEMAKSGRAMMQGLIDGIRSMAGAVINAAASVVRQVRDLLPFSPAKTGPFSGKGYTLYSGQALMEDWARGIAMGGRAAQAAVENVVGATAGAMELEANIATDGYGSIGDKIAAVLAQWGIQIDENGLARMVNNVNRRNQRR